MPPRTGSKSLLATQGITGVSYLELDFSYNERWCTLSEFVEAAPTLFEVHFLFPFNLT